MRKTLIVSIDDLRYVSIQCPQCRTAVVLDMQQPSDFQEVHGFFTPARCPACQTAYDTAVQGNIDRLQKAIQALRPIADRISFHGEPAPAEER